MTVQYKDKTFDVNPKDLAFAKRTITKFTRKCKSSADAAGYFGLYIILLVEMNQISERLIEALGTDIVAEVLMKAAEVGESYAPEEQEDDALAN